MKYNLNNIFTRLRLIVIAFVILSVTHTSVFGMTHIRDIARTRGERNNKLMGWGLVVGLNGTGDGGDVLVTARPLLALLQKLGNPARDLEELKSAKNIALVMLTAEMGSYGVRSGDKLDVTVASLGKASSLEGGYLIPSPLQSTNYMDTNVYAWVDGAVSLPENNIPTAGMIKKGGIMELDFMHCHFSTDKRTGEVTFDLVIDPKQANWQVAESVAMEIRGMSQVPGAELMDEGVGGAEVDSAAWAIDARNIRVSIPKQQVKDATSFIARVMRLPIELPDPKATIVINERTGTIAVTGNVEISPAVVTVGDMTVKIIKPEPVATVNTPIVKDSSWAKMATSTDSDALVSVTRLADMFDLLNVPIQDKINAIYALQDLGVLRAHIEIAR